MNIMTSLTESKDIKNPKELSSNKWCNNQIPISKIDDLIWYMLIFKHILYIIYYFYIIYHFYINL
jgi:hypothetical protein